MMKNLRKTTGGLAALLSKSQRPVRVITDRLPETWPTIIVGIAAFSAIVAFCIWALSQIPQGAASVEVINATQAQSWREILNDPTYLPHKLLSFILLLITDSVRSVRAISILIYLLSGVALFSLLKRWHSARVAVLTLLLYALNAMVLATARFGDPLIMLFSWSILLSLLLWVLHGTSRNIAPILLIISVVLLIYIPGSPYVLLILFILFFNRIKDFFKSSTKKSIAFGLILFLISLTPLIYASLQNYHILLDLALLPDTFSLQDIPGNILSVPSSFFYRFFEADPLLTVGRLPILDLASGSLFLLGGYSYYRNRKMERTKIMVLGGLLAILLGALGQTRLGIALFLPYAFILMAGGISYLLDIWYAVFPRNPLARTIAFIVVALIIASSASYQLKKFFVVWPNTPETKEVYSESRLIQ